MKMGLREARRDARRRNSGPRLRVRHLIVRPWDRHAIPGRRDGGCAEYLVIDVGHRTLGSQLSEVLGDMSVISRRTGTAGRRQSGRPLICPVWSAPSNQIFDGL